MTAARYLIRASTMADVYALAANLRHGDYLEVTSLGIEPRAALRICYRHAILRRTAEIDGEIAAMWGLGGTMLSDVGQPWLLTGPAIERLPVSFVFEARRAVAEMLSIRSILTGHVADSYTRACRLLQVLGFALGEAKPFGAKGALFREFRKGAA